MAISRSLIRPDDLLNIRIEGENLRLDTTQPEAPALVLENAAKPGFLIVHFPPQTVMEQAFYESAPSQPPPDEAADPYNSNHPPEAAPALPAQARIGGPSRLVFRIPAGQDTRIPYTTEGLLDWENLELAVSALADVPAEPTPAEAQSAPGIQAPGRLETAVELPYRLILSPNHSAVWQNAAQPKTHNGFTELWHARMAQKNAEGEVQDLSRAAPAPLRAIWSPDFNPNKFSGNDAPIFGQPDSDWGILTAMTPSDRHEIVVLTSAFHGYVVDKDDFTTYKPLPIYAERLMLSSLGGWLRSHGAWDPPAPFRPFRIVGEVGKERWERYLKDLAQLEPLRRGSLPNLPDLPDELLRDGAAGEGTAGRAEITSAEQAQVLLPGASGLNARVKLVGTEIGSILWPQILGRTGDLLNMSEWTHIATLGRDHYVRIVYEGHLFPFGHRASLVKITERKIRDVKMANGFTAPVAYLVQRMFIVVRQPLRDYTVPEVHNQLEDNGLGLPFRRIRLTTLVTPDIANPPDGSQIPGSTYSFWVRLGKGDQVSDDFKFHAIAEDIAGNLANFTASLIFIPFGEANRSTVFSAYQGSGESRACLLTGPKVTYAPAAAGGANENTSLTTNKLYFKTHSAPVNKKFGGFLPKLLMASVKLPSVEAMLGKPADTTIGYYDPYLKQAAGNTTGLFASIVKETGPGVLAADKLVSIFNADQAGGFATPNLSISGLTSQLGPMAGDLANAAGDIFDPQDFFNDVKDAAKLFGTLSLADLLKPLTLGAGAPKIQLSKETLATPPPALKMKLVTTLDWTPEVHALEFGIVSFHPEKGAVQAKLEVRGRVEKIVELPPPALPDPGFAKMDGSLTNFRIELLHVVEILFNEFAFHSQTGKKLEVAVDLDHDTPIRFIEDLQFVEELRKVIPPELFGDGPSLDINAARIRAGFVIGLPPVGVGVFALRDVTLAAFLELPFLDGRPLFDFSFSSREHPFNLTIMIFGGGGFFHLQIDTLGVKMLEAALEFGASASIDLGVASGGVYIMAGIYFSIQRKTIDGIEVDAATLTGYLRMGGELCILGIISVSLEFYLSFSYEFSKNAAYGRATLTVKVEVLFFSKSVEISVEKRFGGSSGDPYFVEAFDTPELWESYAGAFA